ncbi:folate-sensitive fragile site protein Fra10Ac1-domain-containing protein [Abortiporus biennis]|nr:folate-sensitive fragile site protein Fra10Ac1-domain-containing protein [Abortiporus biennis]
MALYKYGSSSKTPAFTGKTEFDILKEQHKFLRDEQSEEDKSLSWEEKVAKKYYDNLYREFAVCDLKHYKSGNFALRWRTEKEVISGAGETTCGNTRCPFHSSEHVEELRPSLKTLELPFSYEEDGENKFALVKMVLCDKCCRKIMWKRNKEKEDKEKRDQTESGHDVKTEEEETIIPERDRDSQRNESNRDVERIRSRREEVSTRSRKQENSENEDNHPRRHRDSRSRSPVREVDRSRRRRSR